MLTLTEIVQPSFNPAYIPAEGKQNSINVYCNSPTTMVVVSQPWHFGGSWMGVEDTTDSSWPVWQHEWSYGESHELPMREGFVLHYWSGSSPEFPDGHAQYKVVPGQCQEETVSTTSTTSGNTTTTTSPPATTTSTVADDTSTSTTQESPTITEEPVTTSSSTEVTVLGTSTSLVPLPNAYTRCEQDANGDYHDANGQYMSRDICEFTQATVEAATPRASSSNMAHTGTNLVDVAAVGLGVLALGSCIFLAVKQWRKRRVAPVS